VVEDLAEADPTPFERIERLPRPSISRIQLCQCMTPGDQHARTKNKLIEKEVELKINFAAEFHGDGAISIESSAQATPLVQLEDYVEKC
jgi:hypothetical protein